MNIYAEPSQRITAVIIQSSFDLWKDKEFRKLVEFSSLRQKQKDILFNEIQVTALGLALLQIDQLPYLENLEPEVVAVFLDTMEYMGIEQKFLKDWNQFIEDRGKEYKASYDIAINASERWEDFKDDDYLRFIWARVETQTISGLSHIRGQVEKKDPLWVYLRRWLTAVDTIIAQIITQSGLKESLKGDVN